MNTSELILVLSTLLTTVFSLDLETVNQWSFVNFNFPQGYDVAKNFRPENTVPTGFEVTEDRIFIAFPRLRAGVPVTVGVIPRHTQPGSTPVIEAYPDWSYHNPGNGKNQTCSGLITVYRIRRDSCNRLWILDAGIMNSLEEFTVACPPKILIFDLKTNALVRKIEFPKEVLRVNSLLANLVIDETIQGTCDSSMVYMADTLGPGILVYDSKRDLAWRFTHPTMFPDPNFASFEINGERFSLMDGVVGFGFSPKLATLYYQPLATDKIFSVSTTVLRNGPLPEDQELPVSTVGKKASQGLGLAVNEEDETVYFGPINHTSLASWNPITNANEILAIDPERLQFPAEIRWLRVDGGHVWALSTSFQKFFRRNAKQDEINIRLVRVVPDRQQVVRVVPDRQQVYQAGNELYYGL